MATSMNLADAEQAAALIMSLDKPQAAAVLRALQPADVHRLAAAMSGMDAPSSAEFNRVLARFHRDVNTFSGVKPGAGDAVLSLLEEALGEERAKLLGDRLDLHGQSRHINKLKWLEAKTIIDIIRREHPQIQAVVIACLDAKQGSEVLLAFEESRRLDLLGRLSGLKNLTPAALEELDYLLEQYFSEVGRPMGRAMTGDSLAAALLNEMDVGAESSLLNGLRASQPEHAARVEELMFGFGQIVNMAEDDIAILAKQLAPEILAPALAEAGAQLRRRFLSVLTNEKKQAISLLSRRFTQTESMSAQAEIVRVAKQMAAVGEVILDARKIDVF
ncbi:FliG C-terminal domain-containing protein [Zhongshania arctica]|uniref:Flagellar motor switch protein FliG n=1 Tax=Zhongshania arctica TaxID=3238302 RepID=A0ABV3TY55_9GAMM|tara:strand:+ start:2094 stop:3089 length:996 start_codon:yes stop_codon:yes gene_type:complete